MNKVIEMLEDELDSPQNACKALPYMTKLVKDMEIEDATEEELKTVKMTIIIALWCIRMKPWHRPPMNKVIEIARR
ncbi:hypothetical protein L484_014047 [Morus notabilis]|uniref:Receptor-like protein kinase n=1 Tax=Morus notabilis TaxID=981085 RepID=W9RJU7_9ROSA|nr:hypothetical protein L484_014047 [Morus notabilis]